MTTKNQLNKNIELSEKLANYVSKHPDFLIKHKGYSYVVFIKGDKELNKMNEKLIENLVDEGKKVVKATHTKNKKEPWKFELIQI